MWTYASIIGTIVDETGEPFVGATVKACLRVEQAGRMKFDFVNPDASAITDDRGVFRQNNLLPGDYVIVVASASATMPASVQDLYNQALRDGRETELNREINATTALLPTLSGMRVGDSVVGFGRTAMGSEGTFRRPGPGELPAAGGKILIYRTTFYPGTFRAADAGIVTLKAGEERSGINIQLRPVVSTRISGTLIGPDGPQVNMGLRLIPTDTLEDFTNEGGMMNSVTITDAQGAFTFLGIPPAQYTLLAIRQPPMPPVDPNGGPQLPVFQRPAPSEPTLWARVPLSVGEQGLDNVVVSLQRGSRVSGRVEFSGTTSPPPPNRLPQIRVDMSPADGSGAEIMGVLGHNTPVIGRVATDGTFRTYGLPAGKYVAIVDAIPGWFVRSVMLQGRDISSSPLELRDADLDGVVITLTDRPATVTGTVRNGQGVADMTATVLIFPTERTAWVDLGWRPRRVQSTRAGLDSAFTFADVAAGEYFVVAIPDERTANWRDAKFLESLVPSATRIRVDDSGTVRQELTTIRVR
jgi:hypothetical protein